MARKLIKYYDLHTIPVDYSKLYEVYHVEKIYGKTIPSICGYVHKISEQEYDLDIDYLVVINENMIETRKRFTECHELGHIALTHLYNTTHLFDNNSYEYGNYGNYSSKIRNIELEADAFAAELLMPVDKIKHFYFSERIQDTYELAKIFDVSHQAMKYRIKNVVNSL